jgi:hypothetical protein
MKPNRRPGEKGDKQNYSYFQNNEVNQSLFCADIVSYVFGSRQQLK